MFHSSFSIIILYYPWTFILLNISELRALSTICNVQVQLKKKVETFELTLF